MFMVASRCVKKRHVRARPESDKWHCGLWGRFLPLGYGFIKFTIGFIASL